MKDGLLFKTPIMINFYYNIFIIIYYKNDNYMKKLLLIKIMYNLNIL